MIRRFSYSATLAASLLILLTFSCGKTFAPQPELKKEPRSQRLPYANRGNARHPDEGPNAQARGQGSPQGSSRHVRQGQSVDYDKGPSGWRESLVLSEELDLDGSGNAVPVDEVWDNRHKVLYLTKSARSVAATGKLRTGRR